MTKEITIVFADDNLRNKETKIITAFGSVILNSDSVLIERAGYSQEFLTFALCCDDIKGVYNNVRTFIEIPVSKIKNIIVK